MTTKTVKRTGNGKGESDALVNLTNDGEFTIDTTAPYSASVSIEGTSAMLFHRWSNEDVAAKGKAGKNTKAKKVDNVEAYVWRTEDGEIALPGEYLRMSVVEAARYRQDPRSPRKSARDLYKAAVVSLTELATLGKDTWDYLDERRVTIQRNGITRVRPAFLPGWKAQLQLQVVLAEYIDPSQLLSTLVDAGRIIGVGDFRPTYGRFQVVGFEVLEA